jgi:hypothetical protein
MYRKYFWHAHSLIVVIALFFSPFVSNLDMAIRPVAIVAFAAMLLFVILGLLMQILPTSWSFYESALISDAVFVLGLLVFLSRSILPTSGQIQEFVPAERGEEFQDGVATLINLNGKGCARVVEMQRLQLDHLLEVTCIKLMGGVDQIRYIVNMKTGIAVAD